VNVSGREAPQRWARLPDRGLATSDIAEAPDFRITIEPTEKNGLRTRSQIMADKPVTIRRERVGRKVGSLDEKDIDRLNVALAFAVGLAD
jgi:mRNA interferase MazF